MLLKFSLHAQIQEPLLCSSQTSHTFVDPNIGQVSVVRTWVFWTTNMTIHFSC